MMHMGSCELNVYLFVEQMIVRNMKIVIMACDWITTVSMILDVVNYTGGNQQHMITISSIT